MREDFLKTVRMKLTQPSLRVKMAPREKKLDDAYIMGKRVWHFSTRIKYTHSKYL